MVREVTWSVQGHTQEVNWTPGPGIPKPEVFRGHDKLFPKRREEMRSPPLPPNTGLARSGASRVENPILPSALPAEQLAGGPSRSSCLGAGPVPRWDPGAEGPTTPPGTGTVGYLAPSPLLSSRPVTVGTRARTPVSFAQALRGQLHPSLWESPRRRRGCVGLLSCVCVLACSCFCHF